MISSKASLIGWHPKDFSRWRPTCMMVPWHDCGGSKGAPLEDNRRESEEARLRRRGLSPVTPIVIGTKDWRCRLFYGRCVVSLTEHSEARKCRSSCRFLWNLPY